jgi:hypothetical protein
MGVIIMEIDTKIAICNKTTGEVGGAGTSAFDADLAFCGTSGTASPAMPWILSWIDALPITIDLSLWTLTDPLYAGLIWRTSAITSAAMGSIAIEIDAPIAIGFKASAFRASTNTLCIKTGCPSTDLRLTTTVTSAAMLDILSKINTLSIADLCPFGALTHALSTGLVGLTRLIASSAMTGIFMEICTDVLIHHKAAILSRRA